jgi:hypothetical protein
MSGVFARKIANIDKHKWRIIASGGSRILDSSVTYDVIEINECFQDFMLSIKPPYGSREGTSDFRLQTSDFRLWSSDFRLQTSDFRLQTSDFRLKTLVPSFANTNIASAKLANI